MTHGHVRDRRKERQPIRSRAVEIAAVAAILLLCVFLVTGRLLPRFGHGQRDTAWGDLVDSRIATAGAIDTREGGYILYRIEARVRYTVDGSLRDRWMPASGTTSDRVSLQLQLLDAKRCLVTWPLRNEESAHCDLQKASK
jgi:hypothetical protein